jgi:hypothetical protein
MLTSLSGDLRRYSGLLSLGVALLQAACMESQFRLGDSSPIPRSLEAPAGAPRSSLSVTRTNYSVSKKSLSSEE